MPRRRKKASFYVKPPKREGNVAALISFLAHSPSRIYDPSVSRSDALELRETRSRRTIKCKIAFANSDLLLGLEFDSGRPAATLTNGGNSPRTSETNHKLILPVCLLGARSTAAVAAQRATLQKFSRNRISNFRNNNATVNKTSETSPAVVNYYASYTWGPGSRCCDSSIHVARVFSKRTLARHTYTHIPSTSPFRRCGHLIPRAIRKGEQRGKISLREVSRAIRRGKCEYVLKANLSKTRKKEELGKNAMWEDIASSSSFSERGIDMKTEGGGGSEETNGSNSSLVLARPGRP